jgi:hypothetical protein
MRTVADRSQLAPGVRVQFPRTMAIEGAVPIYRVGERLRLSWLHRDRSRPVPPRDDCEATVVVERADVVDARLDDGTSIVLHRFGAQADAPDRRTPRWFVVARLSEV